MRKASYRIAPAPGNDDAAELAVFQFPGQAGGIEANIERWVGQFSERKPEKVQPVRRSVNGLTQHIVEIERGTYSSGMPGGPTTPKAGWAMIAAIVESTDGNWFFKLTGPQKTVESARVEMMKLLEGVRLGAN
jgi:hypothetical protein